MIVDAHQHFWDTDRNDYPWITDELAAIRKPFGPDDLEPLLDASGVQATVLVQTRHSVDETREFLQIAAEHDAVLGVVGWVDLTDPDVGDTLAELQALPEGDRLVGIRHIVHDEEDPRWLLRDDVQAGIAAVGAAGLAYDLLARLRELPAALETSKRHPSMRFVIDHMAKPQIAAERFDEAWAAAMAPFAELPHVSCKLSGLVTEADWEAWQLEDLLPYVRAALDWFGGERLMLGSDWPVCLLAGSYEQVIETYTRALDDLPAETRARILGLNAMRFYRLKKGE